MDCTFLKNSSNILLRPFTITHFGQSVQEKHVNTYLTHLNFLTVCECFIALCCFLHNKCILQYQFNRWLLFFLFFLYSTPHHKVGIPNF